MRNVAGLSTSEAQKSSDMFGKCRYLDETTGGRGVIFATGTPLSNSMTEMYTLMRYLQYNTLQQKGLTHFDTDHPREVADPWFTGDFEATWQDVLEGCTALLEELRS